MLLAAALAGCLEPTAVSEEPPADAEAKRVAAERFPTTGYVLAQKQGPNAWYPICNVGWVHVATTDERDQPIERELGVSAVSCFQDPTKPYAVGFGPLPAENHAPTDWKNVDEYLPMAWDMTANGTTRVVPIVHPKAKAGRTLSQGNGDPALVALVPLQAKDRDQLPRGAAIKEPPLGPELTLPYYKFLDPPSAVSSWFRAPLGQLLVEELSSVPGDYGSLFFNRETPTSDARSRSLLGAIAYDHASCAAAQPLALGVLTGPTAYRGSSSYEVESLSAFYAQRFLQCAAKYDGETLAARPFRDLKACSPGDQILAWFQHRNLLDPFAGDEATKTFDPERFALHTDYASWILRLVDEPPKAPPGDIIKIAQAKGWLLPRRQQFSAAFNTVPLQELHDVLAAQLDANVTMTARLLFDQDFGIHLESVDRLAAQPANRRDVVVLVYRFLFRATTDVAVVQQAVSPFTFRLRNRFRQGNAPLPDLF